MDFGEWLTKWRQKRQLDTKRLVALSGIDQSSISRLENNKMRVSLDTAVRLCHALDVSLAKLVGDITLGGSMPAARRALPKNNNPETLNATDVAQFVDLCRVNSDKARQVIKTICPSSLPAHVFVGEIGKSTSTPLKKAHYPYPNLLAQDIFQIYKKGGVITFWDVGVYSQQVRRAKKFSIREIQSQTKIAYTFFQRLEMGILERIRLSDLLLIDESLGENGNLLALCWSASRFKVGLVLLENQLTKTVAAPVALPRWDTTELHLTYGFIVVCRWLQSISVATEEKQWLCPVRDALQAAR